MPINLDQLLTSKDLSIEMSPKYFDRVLTGSGKNNQGLLNQNFRLSPIMNQGLDNVSRVKALASKKETIYNGDTKIKYIPLHSLSPLAIDQIKQLDIPQNIKNDRVLIAEHPKFGHKVYFYMEPYSLVYEETGFQNKTRRSLTPFMLATIMIERKDQPKDNFEVLGQMRYVNFSSAKGNALIYEFTAQPEDLYRHHEAFLKNNHYNIFEDDLKSYIYGYNMHDGIAMRAIMWQEHIDKEIDLLLNQIDFNSDPDLLVEKLNIVAFTLQFLETYTIPLEIYNNIYQSIKCHLPKDHIERIAIYNMNILLSDTLNKLGETKERLPAIDSNTTATTQPWYSFEQRDAITSKSPLTMVQSAAGTGKAQPLDEPVLTPEGWRKMGELNVGDYVIGSDGKPTMILFIHDQGIQENGYTLEFSDGSKTRANDQHLWTLIDSIDGKETTRDLTTEAWVKLYAQNKSDRYHLPQVKPVDFDEKSLPLHPYFLGALIARGKIKNGILFYTHSEQNITETLSKAAQESGYEMEKSPYDTKTHPEWHFTPVGENPTLMDLIQKLGLDMSFEDKFIPQAYLLSSIKQRTQLLQGLFDNQGKVHHGQGYASYATLSLTLAENLRELLWSLGLPAAIETVNDERGHYYSVKLLGSYNPFYASSYKDQVTAVDLHYPRRLTIVQKLEPTPMRCLELAAKDGLYVTRDYILTHNSSVVLGRVDYMVQSGMKPEDIIVLSFTNVAADNIAKRNKGIKAMTIAKMIHEIYTHNFPGHAISTTQTVINTLDIYYQRSDFIADFKEVLRSLGFNNPNSFTRANLFIKDNFERIVKTLNEIGQTTLELEIAICYNQLDILQEPDEVLAKHLIIDETQDNSIFEFIFILKYAIKHQASIYLVGDSSQTLYEFRNSNPRALNALERSGIFDIYKLQTNYRSKQEILDLANIMLDTIHTNQFSNLQLRANSLERVTKTTFQDRVRLEYHSYPNKASAADELPAFLASTDVKGWIDKCLERGEQVAFLAYTGRNVYKMQEQLEHQYPGRSIFNLVPQKDYNSTVFSAFIAKFWDEVSFIPNARIMDMIEALIMSRLKVLVRSDSPAAQRSVQNFINRWKKTRGPFIKDWAKQYQDGKLSASAFLEAIKMDMLDYEISTNSVRQALLNEKKRKEDKNAYKEADLVVSTIHSAKGLEFDNAFIFITWTNLTEADKRMYYVALTRAMNSEYILIHDTLKSNSLQKSYLEYLDQLPN